MTDNLVRLQKYIADCGIASRRKAEELILHNMIMVNQIVVNELGVKIDPSKDIVTYEGKQIKPETAKVYIMLNKPEGYVTTSNDQFNRPTVLDLVQSDYRIFPIGRLDYDTTGLLLLTNDGELSNILTHPKYKVEKTYIAEVAGILKRNDIESFKKGIKIDDYVTAPANLEVLSFKGTISHIKIVIHEGKNRQIRKMCSAIGHRVLKLKRVKYGNIDLGRLHEGSWRNLTKKEIDYLKNLQVKL